MTTAAVEVIDRGVSRALAELSRRLDDLEVAWERIGGQVLDTIVPGVPVESGALVDDLKAEAGPEGLRIVVGEGVPYAGVINYGWPARNIDGARFMDRAEPSLEEAAPDQLAQEIQDAIDALGLR